MIWFKLKRWSTIETVSFQVIKPIIPLLFLSMIHVMSSCAKPKVIDRRSPADVANLANAKASEDMVKGKEAAFTDFPDWCTSQPQPDGTSCVLCERITDSKDKASLANLCFQSRPDFDPKVQCGLTQPDLGIKTLQCHGAEQDVTADVSLPVDKAATVLTASLTVIAKSLEETYKNDAPSLATANLVVQFATDHVVSVLTGKDQEKTADDLITMANPYLVTSYTDTTGKPALKAALVAKLNAVHDAFAGKEEFTAKKLFTAVLNVAKVFPKERLGKAGDILTGDGIATLIDARKTLLDSVITSWSGNNTGISSSDDLVGQIRGS